MNSQNNSALNSEQTTTIDFSALKNKSNMELISDAAYGMISILKVLGTINRNLSGEVTSEDDAFNGISNRNVAGGLQAALMVLSKTILDLSEE